jgi:uncharacterized protein YndB with AHSA1/START domain
MCNLWLHIEPRDEETAVPEIRHRVGVNAPLADVYEACATEEGPKQWWTSEVEGEGKLGGKLAFRFGRPEPSAVMEVVELIPDERVMWRCVEGPDEWIDTTVTFDLRSEGDESVVVFTHAGWREPVEFMHHCSTSWAYYLLSLKRGLEGGTANPWPENEPISGWGAARR